MNPFRRRSSRSSDPQDPASGPWPWGGPAGREGDSEPWQLPEPCGPGRPHPSMKPSGRGEFWTAAEREPEPEPEPARDPAPESAADARPSGPEADPDHGAWDGSQPPEPPSSGWTGPAPDGPDEPAPGSRAQSASWEGPAPEDGPRLVRVTAAAGSAPSAPGARTWSVLAHLSALIPYVLGLQLLCPLAPLVVWMVRRDDDPESEFHGREALNFQLNVLFWTIVLMITCVGAVLVVPLQIANLVLCIIAAVRAGEGTRYTYPWTTRVVGPPSGSEQVDVVGGVAE